MSNIGELYTLSYPSPPASAVFFTWELWDGSILTSYSPEVDVTLNRSGELQFTAYAVGDTGSYSSHSGVVTVEDHPTVSNVDISVNGEEYGYTTTITVTGSVVGVWLDKHKNPLSGSPSGPSLTISVEEDTTLIYRQDSHGIVDTYVNLWGKPRSVMSVSPIFSNPGRGRTIPGKYTDFFVLTKKGYSCTWNLGGFEVITINDSVVEYGDLVRYKARVNTVSRGLSETTVSFTATDSGKSKTVVYKFVPSPNYAPTPGTFTISDGTNTADDLVDFWVDEGKTVTFTADSISDPAWVDNAEVGDLVQYTWEFTSEKDGKILPKKYGRTVKLDTSGFGGGGITGTLTCSDPYGFASSVDINRIVVSRPSPSSVKVELSPSSPVAAGIPVVATISNDSIWNMFSRFDSESAWNTDLPSSSEYSRQRGAVFDTSGQGGSAVAGSVVVTDDSGEESESSFNISTGNRSPASVVVWNNAYGNKVEAGTPVTFYACSLDPDGDTGLVYEWKFTNPVSFKTGASVTVQTSNNMVGSRIYGNVTVYDPAQDKARSTDDSIKGVTFPIKDVLVMTPYNDTGIIVTTPDGPDCPECSEVQVVSPEPVLIVSGQSSLYAGIQRGNAFMVYYSGYDITRVRKVLSGTSGYICDTGYISAPNPRQYTEYLSWDGDFKLSSQCSSPFDTVGAYVLTLYVELSDGRVFSDYHQFTVGVARFTNEHQGTLSLSCASGYCGSTLSIEVVAGYDATTTNQSFEDLGLNPETSTAADAQQAVNSRAVTIANTLLSSRSTSEPWCYPIGEDCVCTAIGSALDAQIVAKWTGDKRVAAQAAASEIALGNWSDYSAIINNISYNFSKTQVGSTSAMLCLVSALSVTPNTYITLVFDSSGSMNSTLLPLRRITASPSGKLYRALASVYAGEFDTKVKVESDSSELWASELSSHIKPSPESPSREQIVMVFSDEDSNYNDTTAIADAEALYTKVNDPASFDYYVGIVFSVNTAVATKVQTRWDTVVSASTNFSSLTTAPAGSIAQLKLIRDVEDAGDHTEWSEADADAYYFGIIQSALSSAGINIEDPDAV